MNLPAGILHCLILVSVVLTPEPVHGEPPPRTGLWALQKVPEDSRALETFSRKIRANSQISGVCLHVAWESIEVEPNKPDFKALDRTVAVLRELGMKYQLCLKPGASTPAFVFQEGAQPFLAQINNPHRSNFGERVKIPIPWDPIYQRQFTRIIEDLGKQYASDPLCVSVVLTCANFLSAETHLPKTRTDLTRWDALGDYQSKLLTVYQKYTDVWAQAFPRQEISLHLSKVLDLPPAFNEQVIDYGLKKYPQRFTIQNCQLTGRREDVGMMTYDLVQKYGDRIHHGFQSLAGLSRPNERMGSIEMAALNVVHGHGEYWELWTGDGLSPETSAAVKQAWDKAKSLGYDGYKKQLIAEGKYRH